MSLADQSSAHIRLLEVEDDVSFNAIIETSFLAASMIDNVLSVLT